LKKKALAERVGVSGSAVTRYEDGSMSPASEVAEKIAAELEFPIDFFYGEEIEPIHPGLASFRALRSMRAPVRDRVVATEHSVAGIISTYLEAKFSLPVANIPDVHGDDVGPTLAAEELRRAWKIGQGPISNLVHLLEGKGVHIYWIQDPSLTVDAVSLWHDGRPYIILSALRPGERQRLSVGHELGHLIFHRDVATDDREAEQEAFAFAGSFLLPEGPFRKAFRGTSSVSDLFATLFRIKRDWGVSVAAGLRRSRDLHLITQGQYVNACRELSIQGMRKEEPCPLPHEQSYLHDKIFARLARENVLPEDLARELHIYLPDLLELMPVARRYQPAETVSDGEAKLRLLD
jgi:Zn-dependent peptidase ImmA (M78 family)/DNA-binding XRE family transcriptional regulator